MMREEDRATIENIVTRHLSHRSRVEIEQILTAHGAFVDPEFAFRGDSDYEWVQDHLVVPDGPPGDRRLVDLHRALTGQTFEETPEPWLPRHFRLFLSHVHTERVELSELKKELLRFGIDGLLAHETINPTSEWQRVIETALSTCDGCAVFLTPDFHQSKWTDQEIGFCVSRGVVIVSAALGTQPYGFIGRYQSLPGKRPLKELAEPIFSALLGNPRSGELTRQAILHRFEDSESFDDANRLSALLRNISGWTDEQIDAIEKAQYTNVQVGGAFGLRPLLQRIASLKS